MKSFLAKHSDKGANTSLNFAPIFKKSQLSLLALATFVAHVGAASAKGSDMDRVVPLQTQLAAKPVAKPAAKPKPVVHTSTPATGKIHVNADSLRRNLLSGDTSVLVSLNGVYQAKVNVDASRGRLLPGIALAPTLSPSFLLSAVKVLLPFLLPSNWYNLDASEHQLAASGYAYYLVELNEYASALALYETIVGDYELRAVYQKNYDNLENLFNIVSQAYNAGVETKLDVDTASSNAEIARDQLSLIDELLDGEIAQIRHVMGLPLPRQANMTVDMNHMSALPEESLNQTTILARAMAISPEEQQAQSLVAAAKDLTGTATFGFLGEASLSVATTGASRGTVTSGASIAIGGDYLPSIELSSLNTSLMKVRERDVKLELAAMIESALGSVKEVSLQEHQTALAIADAQAAYDATLQLYSTGATDLLHVTTAAANLTVSGVAHAKAMIDLDGQRITLNRVLIKNQFSSIPSCKLKEVGNTGFFGWLSGIFSPGTMTSVDEVCHPSASAAAQARS